MEARLSTLDYATVIMYLVIVVGFGTWIGIHKRRKMAGSSFFLAGRSLTWPIIGLALFSTNISTTHLVSLAQEGFVNGLAYGNFEWMAPFLLIILSFFFAPLYIRSKVSTLPDFLETRYSRPSRDFLAFVSILAAIFIHIGFTIYTGAVVLRGILGVDINVSIVSVAILTGIYTVVGGLLSVVITESIDTIVLISGALCLTIFAYHHVGGWSGLAASVEPVKLTILRSSDDPSNLPWYSVLLGYPVLGLWYWCADQTIVQRVLGAKDENHARIGPLFAGFIKILPVFIFVLPGLLCLGLVNQGHLPLLPMKPAATVPTTSLQLDGNERMVFNAISSRPEAIAAKDLEAVTQLDKATVHASVMQLVQKGAVQFKSEDTYAHMILNLLPVGLRGLIAAALLAALMSTVSGALNSISTLVAYDIYRRWRPETTDRTLVRVGRIATGVGMIVAIVWSPMLSHFESIFQGITALICFISPPITAVFVWGVFIRRISSLAAIWTLWSGFALGLVIFFLDWFKDSTGWNVPPMMVTFYLFILCSATLFIISYFRPHQHTAESSKLVWGNPSAALQFKGWRGLGNYKLIGAALAAAMISLYIVFK